VPLSGNPTFADFVPSKLIDFMATGHPVIVSAAGQAARVTEQVGGGMVIPPEDPPALADAVRRLAANPGLGREMGSAGRAFAAGMLRSTQAEHLEQVLVESLVPPG
jgi:glycosyltransferase involved in cell wall biosynthesis